MFTGLVEATGRVETLERSAMTGIKISVPKDFDGVGIGDSVSVNGVCLTVNKVEGRELRFLVMPETLRRTALSSLARGSVVNLERAMSPAGRFGGHIVQGHVDGVGEVLSVEVEGEAEIWEFEASEAVLRYTVEKGGIAVDGISLTVVSVGDSSFTVSVLPQTRRSTNLRTLRVRDLVNLEADVIGKYVERLLEPRLGKKV